MKKFERNAKRDRSNVEALSQRGFDALVIWECETRGEPALSGRLAQWFAERTELAGA